MAPLARELERDDALAAAEAPGLDGGPRLGDVGAGQPGVVLEDEVAGLRPGVAGLEPLVLLRGVYHSTAEVAAGHWPRSALSHGREIAGKTLGIVGYGGIGRESARLGRALGMRVIGFDPQVPATSPLWPQDGTVARDFAEVLAEADVVTLHVPLSAATRNLLDAARIATMKPDAILINTARGGVVDETAVADALRAGTLGGAALDVFDDEPLDAGSPLAGCPRLILTPHVAGVSRESNDRVSSLIAEQVAAALTARA
jgi:(S)-sulfolactate dehydrogenase